MIGLFTPFIRLNPTPVILEHIGTSGNRNLPAGAQAGDLCVYTYTRRSGTPPPVPSGFTDIASAFVTNIVGSLSVRSSFKVLLPGDIGVQLPSTTGSDEFHSNTVFRPNRKIGVPQVLSAVAQAALTRTQVTDTISANAENTLSYGFLGSRADGVGNFLYGDDNSEQFTTDILSNSRNRIGFRYVLPQVNQIAQFENATNNIITVVHAHLLVPPV